jgi:hypothetical protein
VALYNRTASVYVDASGVRTVITNVRVTFQCEKSTDSTKNTARINIYNLAEATRIKFEAEKAQVTLLAGYIDDTGEEIIFIGDVVNCVHRYASPDIITEVELKDGHNALKEARLSESFKPGTTMRQVVGKLADSIGLPIKEISGNLEEQFSQGVSVAGPVSEQMDKILQKAGLQWHVTDGELEVIEENTPNRETVVVLSAGTGLIGRPENLVDENQKLEGDKNTNKKLKAESLLIPKLNPARRVKIQSEEVDGLFRIKRVTHRGDTHGQEWLSEIEVQET